MIKTNVRFILVCILLFTLTACKESKESSYLCPVGNNASSNYLADGNMLYIDLTSEAAPQKCINYSLKIPVEIVDGEIRFDEKQIILKKPDIYTELIIFPTYVMKGGNKEQYYAIRNSDLSHAKVENNRLHVYVQFDVVFPKEKEFFGLKETFNFTYNSDNKQFDIVE